MKTSNFLRSAILILVLGTSSSILVGQSLKTTGGLGLPGKYYSGMEVSPAMGLNEAFSPYNAAETNRGGNEFTPMELLPSSNDGLDIRATIEHHMVYPRCAREQKIEGTVLIQFTVDTQGSVTDTKILKDIGGLCGRIAEQAVSEMKFKPAMQNGFPVPCKMVVPVRFELQ